MKFKLTAIYVCILIALSSVGYISYHGLTNLMNALRLAVQPDERLMQITEFVNLLHSGENYMRLYSITRVSDYRLAHNQNMRSMEEQLNRLFNASEGDPVIMAGLDSIRLNLMMKMYYHDQLIRLKSISVLPEMGRRILTEADSIESQIHVQMEKMLKDSAAVQKTEEKKGFFARLFGSGKRRDEVTLNRDSLLMIEKNKIKIAGPIKNTLEEFNEKEIELKKMVMEKELGYTVENAKLTEKMIRTAELIGVYLDRLSRAKAGEASQTFNHTTRYIAWAGAVSALLLLGMMLVIARDVRVILKTKKELEAATSKAENLAKAREDFLATMSHEIRTPLNSMIGMLDQFRNEEITENDRNILAAIRKSSGHLSHVVNGILDYSKLEAGYLHFEDVRFNAWHIVQESLAMFRKEAADKSLDLSAAPDEKIMQNTISWDPVRLRQVLFNLISNAIKFTKKGSVHVFAGLNGDTELILRVKDTGIGIRKELQKKIFDRYIQADDIRAGDYGGTGLGLAIVKKIVDLRGGEIRVESRVNEGAVFSVSIPVKVFREDQTPIRAPGPVIDLSNLSVLVADDDEYSRMIISRILRDHHAAVFTASDGWSAFRMIEDSRFDILVLDIHMPLMNGLDVVRANGGRIPSIAISAHIDERIKVQCMEAGFRRVFRKPVEETEFLQTIPGLLEGGQYRFKEPGKIPSTGVGEGGNTNRVEPGGNGIPVNKKLVDIYYQNISSALDEISRLTIDKDFEKIRFISHKLIPSTRCMGYDRLAFILQKIDELTLSVEKNSYAGNLVADFTEHARIIIRGITERSEN